MNNIKKYINTNNIELISYLKSNPDKLSIKIFKRNLLLIACSKNLQFEIIKYLFEQDFDLNEKDRFSNTVLAYAIKNKNIEAIELILSKAYKIDWNFLNSENNNYLNLSIKIPLFLSLFLSIVKMLT